MIFHCPFCGMKAAPNSLECSACNRRMVRPCPHCQESVALTASLCKYCGEELTGGPEPVRVAARTERPDIEFIEERPRRKSRGGLVLALLVVVLLGLGANFALRCAGGGRAARIPAKPQMISAPEEKAPAPVRKDY